MFIDQQFGPIITEKMSANDSTRKKYTKSTIMDVLKGTCWSCLRFFREMDMDEKTVKVSRQLESGCSPFTP